MRAKLFVPLDECVILKSEYHYMKIVLLTSVLRSCVVFTKSNLVFSVLCELENNACSSSRKTSTGRMIVTSKAHFIFVENRNTTVCLV